MRQRRDALAEGFVWVFNEVSELLCLSRRLPILRRIPRSKLGFDLVDLGVHLSVLSTKLRVVSLSSLKLHSKAFCFLQRSYDLLRGFTLKLRRNIVFFLLLGVEAV